MLASAQTQRNTLDCDTSPSVCVSVFSDCREVTKKRLKHLSKIKGLKKLKLTGEQASLISGQGGLEGSGSSFRERVLTVDTRHPWWAAVAHTLSISGYRPTFYRLCSHGKYVSKSTLDKSSYS